MKIRSNKGAIILFVSLIILGVCGILLVTLNNDITIDDISPLLIFGLGALSGVIGTILSTIDYIVFDSKEIKSCFGNKIRRELLYDKIKRIIVLQINFHGTKNERIIFDDGTFSKEQFSKNNKSSRQMRDSVSWIAIEYTNKRFEAVKQILPNYPVEILPPDQY